MLRCLTCGIPLQDDGRGPLYDAVKDDGRPHVCQPLAAPVPGAPQATFTITFTIPDGPMWEHRGPDVWLDDLARLARYDTSRLSVDVEGDGLGNLLVEVTGTEDGLRFVCVALNLHAEQTPWDTTPPEQARALEDLVSG